MSRPRSRGRAPSHSGAEVAKAAIVIADSDGLAAVTMRAVATAIGTGAASLYRYVKNRDELIALMVDEVNGEFRFAASTTHGWVNVMVDLADQARAIYRRHPWMVEALETTPVLGPNGCAYLDYALAVLAPTRADGRTALEAVGVFNALVRMLCKQEHDRRPTAHAQDAQAHTVADQLAALTSTSQYPHLAAALADAAPTGDQFHRVLRRVLNGLLPSDN